MSGDDPWQPEDDSPGAAEPAPAGDDDSALGVPPVAGELEPGSPFRADPGPDSTGADASGPSSPAADLPRVAPASPLAGEPQYLAAGFDPFGALDARGLPAGFDPFGARDASEGDYAQSPADPEVDLVGYGEPLESAELDRYQGMLTTGPHADPAHADAASDPEVDLAGYEEPLLDPTELERLRGMHRTGPYADGPYADGPAQVAGAATREPKTFLGEPTIFSPVRWLLLIATLLAVLPLYAAQRRGLAAGFESKARLQEAGDLAGMAVTAINGSFGYSEWTGALLVLATLVAVAGRVERSWGSGVLAAAFLLGGGVFNALRLDVEGGSPSLIAISGGWTGAALVLGLGSATRGRSWPVWLMSAGLLALVGQAGGSVYPVAVALAALFVGYGVGRALKPSYSAQPTARGCLLLVLTVGLVFTLEFVAVVRSVRMPELSELWRSEPSRPRPQEVGPLTPHTVAHLELTLDLPAQWRDSGRSGERYVVFYGEPGSFLHLFRFEAHPFSRAPDTWVLRNVLGTLDSPNSYYGHNEVRDEGTISGTLGRGYQVLIRCDYRFTDGSQAGTRCSYAFELEDDMVWIDCFVPDGSREDPEAYARLLFDSIARTVRPTAEEDPK